MIIDASMGRRDDNEIEPLDCSLVPWNGFGSGPLRVFACWANHGHIRIVISHVGAALRKFLEQPVAGRLPFVIHVGFVGKAEYKNPTAFYRFALVIEASATR